MPPLLILREFKIFDSQRIWEIFLFNFHSMANMLQSRGRFWQKEKNFFWKIDTLINIFWHLARIFQPSGKIFSAGLSKLHFTCPGEHFEDFFEQYFIFLSFSDIEWKILILLSKLFQRGCQNRILCVQRNTLSKKKYFFKIFYFFIIFGHWAKSFRQGCRNCILGVQTNILGSWKISRVIANA